MAAQASVTPSTVRACARALGEDQERERRHRQDQQAAHGRRALLDAMARRPLLADVLAERALAQERDERAAAEHRQERGQHARTEHVRHSAASASRSTPAEREPLSSTTSPGRSTRGSSSAASANVGRPVPFAALGRRRVPGCQLADADHDVDAQPRAGAPDLGVPARRIGAELGHRGRARRPCGRPRRARRARPARSRPRPGWRCRRR